jgi:hypothetical protein
MGELLISIVRHYVLAIFPITPEYMVDRNYLQVLILYFPSPTLWGIWGGWNSIELFVTGYRFPQVTGSHGKAGVVVIRPNIAHTSLASSYLKHGHTSGSSNIPMHQRSFTILKSQERRSRIVARQRRTTHEQFSIVLPIYTSPVPTPETTTFGAKKREMWVRKQHLPQPYPALP